MNFTMKEMTNSVGVSNTTLKRYEDDGLIPPVMRTNGGQRRYEEIHRTAFMTIRSLLQSFPFSAAYELMHLALSGSYYKAYWIINEEQHKLFEERHRLELNKKLTVEMNKFPTPKRTLKIGEVAKLAKTNTSAIRYWEERGLIHSERDSSSGFRYYIDSEIRKVLLISSLRKSVYFIEQIEKIISFAENKNTKEIEKQFKLAHDQLDEHLERQLNAVSQFQIYIDLLKQKNE